MKMLRNIITAAVLTLSAMTVFAQNNGTWTIYDTRTSDIGGNNVSAMVPDNRGIWVGTYQGLSRLKGGSWMDYSMFNEKLKDQSVNCLMLDKRGVIWIGTDDYGVIEFDGTHWTEHNAETRRLKMKFVKEIVEDLDGVMWIGVTLGGVVSYDGSVWEKYTPDDSELLSDFVLDIAVDRANRKWVTTNGGVSVYNGRRWTGYTVSNSDLPDNIVPAIAIDKDNVKWFGTLNGMASFDGENWKVWNTGNSPLPSNQVNDIAIDRDGLLWIATNAGAAVFDGVDRWVVFTSKNSGLFAGNIYKVVNDRYGNHWFASDVKGLAKLSGFVMPEKVVAPVVATPPVTPEAESPTQQSTSKEKVHINPYLDAGYVTISMESPSATVTFYSNTGKVAKIIDNYKPNQKIKINRMPKGMYIVSVKTVRGERKIKFNLK